MYLENQKNVDLAIALFKKVFAKIDSDTIQREKAYQQKIKIELLQRLRDCYKTLE